MEGIPHPELLADGVVEVRRWRTHDVTAVHAARGGTIEQARAWLERQQVRSAATGVSCAVALPGQDAVGYVGLIRRPRVEMGVVRDLEDGDLVFKPHQRVVGMGYWTAPEHHGQGFATRGVVLLSRWALRSAGMIRVEALVDPSNTASRRVIEKSGFRQEGHLRSYLDLENHPTDALAYSLLQSDLLSQNLAQN